MGTKKPTPSSDQEPNVVTGEGQELVQRLTDYYGSLLALVSQRGSGDGYGDPLRPTGGLLSLYMIIERKMDRLRSQFYRPILAGKPMNPKMTDSIDDLINYLAFLRMAIADEVPAS